MYWPGCQKGPFWAEIGIQMAHRVSSLYTPWFDQLKKKTNFLLVQNRFLFLSLPVGKEIMINVH